jgi:Protein of unknown function (DUF1616)
MLNTDEVAIPTVSDFRRVMIPGRRADNDRMRQADTLEAPVGAVADPPEPPGPTEVPEIKEGGHRWWPAAVVVLLVALLSLAIPTVRHQWALSFVRQPTHYTALSFDGAADLPTTITAGSAVNLSFSIANNEGRNVDYPVVVTSAGTKAGTLTTASSVLHRSTVTVPAGGQRSTSVSVVPVCSTQVCRVTVTLPGHGESIDVLLHVKTPTS